MDSDNKTLIDYKNNLFWLWVHTENDGRRLHFDLFLWNKDECLEEDGLYRTKAHQYWMRTWKNYKDLLKLHLRNDSDEMRRMEYGDNVLKDAMRLITVYFNYKNRLRRWYLNHSLPIRWVTVYKDYNAFWRPEDGGYYIRWEEPMISKFFWNDEAARKYADDLRKQYKEESSIRIPDTDLMYTHDPMSGVEFIINVEKIKGMFTSRHSNQYR